MPCAGWPNPAGMDPGAQAHMQALMQIIGGTPQAMEIQRQLAAGAGPFSLQGIQVPSMHAWQQQNLNGHFTHPTAFCRAPAPRAKSNVLYTYFDMLCHARVM